MRFITTLLVTSFAATPLLAQDRTERFAVFQRDARVGSLVAETRGDTVTTSFDAISNGRGPRAREVIRLDAQGLPVAWTVTGNTTFGSKVDERFERKGRSATWRDASGPGKAAVAEPALYVPQDGSPWGLGLQARALLKDADRSMPALPGGTLALEPMSNLTLSGTTPLKVRVYALSGIGTLPDYVLLDDSGALVAHASPFRVVVREGYEGENGRLRDLAAQWGNERLAAIHKAAARHYDGPVRITNVRLFDPAAKALTGPVQVVVSGNSVASVQPADASPTPGETIIDGAGGTLVPGMFEMHAHMSAPGAMLNLIAGITSARDMANNNAVLADLSRRIDSGEVGGPRLIRAGMIEGKSPFNNAGGILASSEAEAVAAVRWYAARGAPMIKIYQSVNPAWVPAMVAEAHRLGLKVGGHVPAFSTPDAMVEAGYDEISHLNQLVFGWIGQPGDDTRTLFRLTGLKRLADFDLGRPDVQRTLNLIAKHGVAVDATHSIHERLHLSRDGQLYPGAADYVDHLPISGQRDARKADVPIENAADDAAYRKSFDTLMQIGRMLHRRGVMILPGTDTGGSFTYHRTLELMQQMGMSPAEVLSRATLEMARYTGQDQRLGSIARGKLADFFLVPGDPTKDLKAVKRIAMVVKDGTVYFPAEVYPKFGIKPFAPAPRVTTTQVAAAPVQLEKEVEHAH